jgi:hypothetical protein
MPPGVALFVITLTDNNCSVSVPFVSGMAGLLLKQSVEYFVSPLLAIWTVNLLINRLIFCNLVSTSLI